MAYALDLLGERWTLLIVRELFLGPRRFGDLHTNLPGIGTNLLSKRLKELEEAGLVVAAPGEARSQYRLTEIGESLRPTIRALMHWSIEYFMGQPEPSAPQECIYSNNLQPDSVALAVEMFANLNGVPGDNYVMQLGIDDSVYTYYFMNNQMTARRGADAPAIAKVSTDVGTLMQAMRGEIYSDESRRRSKVSGNEKALDHFFSILVPGADTLYEVTELIKSRKAEDERRIKARSTAAPRHMAEV